MMHFLLLFGLCTSLLSGQATAAGERLLTLSDEQAAHLGIRLMQPDIVKALPLGRAPARVVLPPENEYVVSAPQSGIVEHVGVALGANVRQGQTMARIQSPALLEMQRILLDATTEFSVAHARLARDQTLLDEGVISRMRSLETKSQYDRAEAALKTAEQTLAISGCTAKEIKNLENSHTLNSLLDVRSPVSGTVLERVAVVGQRVELLSPLFRVGRLTTLWLEVAMPQERLSEVAKGDDVRVETPEAGAHVIQISRSVTPESQTSLIRAVVDSGTEGLRPGMNVNVQLLHGSHDPLFRLPLASVFLHEGKPYVFVKTPQGYQARSVVVAGEESHFSVIRSGLSAHEQVVVEGIAALKAAWQSTGEGE